MTYKRFIRCGSAKPVANYYEAVRPSPAHRYILSASRLEPLTPFPLPSPARFYWVDDIQSWGLRPHQGATLKIGGPPGGVTLKTVKTADLPSMTQKSVVPHDFGIFRKRFCAFFKGEDRTVKQNST